MMPTIAEAAEVLEAARARLGAAKIAAEAANTEAQAAAAAEKEAYKVFREAVKAASPRRTPKAKAEAEA